GPVVAAVGRFEQDFAAEVDGLGVVRRQVDRAAPVETVAAAGLDALAAGLAAAALAVVAAQAAVLRFPEDDVGVGRIDLAVKAVAAADLPPVAGQDAVFVIRGAGAAPAAVVLQAAVDVVRLAHV